jgi:hypothetical protein
MCRSTSKNGKLRSGNHNSGKKLKIPRSPLFHCVSCQRPNVAFSRAASRIGPTGPNLHVLRADKISKAQAQHIYPTKASVSSLPLCVPNAWNPPGGGGGGDGYRQRKLPALSSGERKEGKRTVACSNGQRKRFRRRPRGAHRRPGTSSPPPSRTRPYARVYYDYVRIACVFRSSTRWVDGQVVP